MSRNTFIGCLCADREIFQTGRLIHVDLVTTHLQLCPHLHIPVEVLIYASVEKIHYESLHHKNNIIISQSSTNSVMQWRNGQPWHINIVVSSLTLSDHVSADSDSAEDNAEDSEAAVDEEEDEEEVLVEEDQIQTSVRTINSSTKPLAAWQWSYSVLSCCVHSQEGDEEDSDEAADQLITSHPDADTTIIFMTGEGWFPFIRGFHSLSFFTVFTQSWICWGETIKLKVSPTAWFCFTGVQLCCLNSTT